MVQIYVPINGVWECAVDISNTSPSQQKNYIPSTFTFSLVVFFDVILFSKNLPHYVKVCVKWCI